MSASRLRVWALVLISMLAAIACNKGPDRLPPYGAGAFPWEGRLSSLPDSGGVFPPGDTIAVTIDSNYVPFWDALEVYKFTRGNTTVRLTNVYGGSSTFNCTVPVRTVFELQPAPTSYRASIQPGVSFTVVLFDLPNVAQLNGCGFPTSSLPQLVAVRIDLNGESVVPETHINVLSATGGQPHPLAEGQGGPPDPFGDLQRELTARRMVRFRPVRSATPNGFPETIGPIASIQFDVEYPRVCVQDPAITTAPPQGKVLAYGATEAARSAGVTGANVLVTSGTVRTRVVLLDPDGFTLGFSNTGGSLSTDAGQGPLFDLVFDPIKPPAGWGCTFDASTVKIFDLVVSGVDGAGLVVRNGDSSSVFTRSFVTPLALDE